MIAAGVVLGAAAFNADAAQPSTPDIRSSPANRVPACVTPDRMMQYLRTQNDKLDAKFVAIAGYYKQHGEALGIRWDYAIYQMILETNYLKFKRGDGSSGDVKIRQNNFAGVGATGGGVPGDSFPDVSTGVLAQMQHLLAYSGERVDNPVAPRTREQQDGIIAQSLKLKRPVRFGDLTQRWAADRNYARSIEAVADRFRNEHCTGKPDPVAVAVPAPAPAKIAAAVSPVASPADAAKPTCAVMTASYGGTAALLIRNEKPAAITYTALKVEAGQEQIMGTSFIAGHAAGGQVVGRYRSQDEAVKEGFARCAKPKS
jgi:Mannosyl-glycoprotein endo-beta-N-acetylglucosaminidase